MLQDWRKARFIPGDGGVSSIDNLVEELMKRQDILEEAKRIITQDRQSEYGEPENSFSDISEFWSTYLGIPVRPHQVAACMILVKLARIKKSPTKIDNWLDGAGYSACGGELATGDKT